MNKEVKDLIQPYNPNVKKGTWYVTSSTRDIKKPYLIARLEELEAENKLLKEKVNQLETNRDEAIEYISKLEDYPMLTKYNCLEVVKILERGKE